MLRLPLVLLLALSRPPLPADARRGRKSKASSQVSGAVVPPISSAAAGAVISGGAPLLSWVATSWPGAPAGSVLSADVSHWPVEIQSLRVGASVVPRARYPPKVGTGQAAANWLFAAPWSNSTVHGTDFEGRHPALLGVNASALPAGASRAELVGAYAHVLGCVEKDVNSQLTKVDAVLNASGQR